MKTAIYIGLLGIIYYLAIWVEDINDQTSLKIGGVGKYNQSDLIFASKVIEDFANIKTVIIEPISTNDKTVYRYKEKQLVLDCNALHHKLPFNSFTKRLMLVSSEEFSDGDQKIGGVAFNFDKVAFVSSSSKRLDFKITIIHEYCHLLKLKHCENTKCIMNAAPHSNDAKDLCQSCKDKINFSKGSI